MKTIKSLRELEKKTYLQCRDLQFIPAKEINQKNKTMFKIVDQQNELKDKNKFYKNLLKEMEKQK